jgi:hypothetical protein
MSRLIDYWPSQEGIDDCIRTEAETVDEAILLAVHEPVALRTREEGSGLERVQSEQDLLDALLRPAGDGSAVVVAVTGDSGVGKSHMIRWLHAQLQRHPARDRLEIILIPKTASLRQVVELILEPLKGEAYDKLRLELGRVTASMSPDNASRLLATALTIELQAREKQWHAEAQANPADRSLRERIQHARGLQVVLFQTETFESWLRPVLLRVVGRALHGGSEAATGDARRFEPCDLEIPTDFDITAVSHKGQQYMHLLQQNDGAGRPVAARVLQDALDPALRSVFRFSEALGQRTVEEIVGDIRSLLGKDRELVLLIEDFAALAGIQETLLNLMIAESDRQGERVRATLRTALAVTDGFLPTRQTILTRAKREWVIPNVTGSEPEMVARLTQMAGRYLNAARWGKQSLRAQYRERGEGDLYTWVKPFVLDLDAQEQDGLQAFGSTDQGHPLFPLSPIAIEVLARRDLTVNGRLLFNPRKFINAVLREVLLKRDMQERGRFPPPLFKAAILRTDADLELRSQGHTGDVRDRLVPALAIWAGDPKDLTGPPQVDKALFNVFGLPWPFSEGGATQRPQPTPERKGRVQTSTVNVAQTVTTQSSAPEPGPGPGPESVLEPELEGWANGAIGQRAALRIRNLLASAMGQRMDWNTLRMCPTNVQRSFFWLPFAQVGNPTAGPKFVVAEEVRPVPAPVRRAIAALDRWEVNGNSWDYPRSEEDYAYAQALLDQLEQQVTAWLVDRARRQATLAGRVLHRQALLLGLSRRADPQKPGLSELLAPAPQQVLADGVRELPHVGQIIAVQERACQTRSALREVYVSSLACFQGDGTSPHALDASRVLLAWKAEDGGDAQLLQSDNPGVANAAAELGTPRLPALVQRYANGVKSLRPKVLQLTEPAWDAETAAAARKVISNANRMGVLASQAVNMAEIERSLAWLETPEARDVIRAIREFTEPSGEVSAASQLAGWAKLDLNHLTRAQRALLALEGLLQATQRQASAGLRAAGGGDVADKMSGLMGSLRVLEGQT